MYAECKQYLIGKLKATGIRTNPYTSHKALESCQESHVGAVLFAGEDLLRNGSKTIYKDNGATRKRRKIFDRDITMSVIIGDYSDDRVEQIFERFVQLLDKGIEVDGNYVPIEPVAADWVDRDDSILRARVAVQIKVIFHGGIYRDTDFAKLTGIEVGSIERTNKK